MDWKFLKAHFSVEALLAASGKLQGLRVSGNRLIGPCPLHAGDNPTAFSVDRTRDLWYCFTRCATGGDSLALAWRLCGCSWPATAQWLATLLPSGRPIQTARLQRPPPSSFREASLSVARRRPRGFTPFTRTLPLEVAHPFLRQRGLTPAILRHFEAGVWLGHGFLEGMAAVRLHDLDGRPLGYAGRRLDPDEALVHGKWKWPPTYPKNTLLYNWHRARPYLSSGLVVVESPWSAMRLTQEGVPNTVALGGLTVSPAQSSLLAAANHLVLMLDGDAPGDQATQRLVATRIHPRLHLLRPPAGTDPADLDRQSLRALLAPLGRIAPSSIPKDSTTPASNTLADTISGNSNDQCRGGSSPDPQISYCQLHGSTTCCKPVADNDLQPRRPLPPLQRFRLP